jgi:hypothetical protein
VAGDYPRAAPGKRRGMARRWLPIVAGCGALLAAGCGAPPPQAPKPQAQKVDTALTALATDCGHAREALAFAPGPGSALARLERAALPQAQALAGVARRNGDWIYQGQDMRQLLKTTVSALHDCGLRRTSAALDTARRAIASAGRP